MAAERKISYGLYVVTVHDGQKDTGCICNTLCQVTTSPNQVTLTLNKGNYTTEVLRDSGIFNVSILSEKADFSIFQRFGFQSGREADKFKGFEDFDRSGNQLPYILRGANGFLSGRVVNTVDIGTHILFIAEVTETGDIAEDPSATYGYYHSHIKPEPQPQKESGDGPVWKCRICGHEYRGEVLPKDYVCPICKHGPEDFELLKLSPPSKG